MGNTSGATYNPPGLDLLGIGKGLYTGLTGGDSASFVHTLSNLWDVYSLFALLFSFIFFAGFIYAKVKWGELFESELEEIKKAEIAWATKHDIHDTRNARWDAIQTRVTENSPESWRIAIIEADIMLDETLANAGYVGQTLGEKLKSANVASFTTIQDAWEAHKVRNEIAHVGSDFVLTKRSAEDTLMRFERVFREFGVI